jgi:fumarate reductase subunit C
MEARLYLAQRLSAMVLAPLTLAHLGLIFWAVQGGLTAAEIGARAQAHPAVPWIYALFAVAAAVHAPIGLRNVLREWTPMPRAWVDRAMAALFVVLLFLGLRAAVALGSATWAVAGAAS